MERGPSRMRIPLSSSDTSNGIVVSVGRAARASLWKQSSLLCRDPNQCLRQGNVRFAGLISSELFSVDILRLWYLHYTDISLHLRVARQQRILLEAIWIALSTLCQFDRTAATAEARQFLANTALPRIVCLPSVPSDSVASFSSSVCI